MLSPHKTVVKDLPQSCHGSPYRLADARSRKQYRYHPLWNYLRNETKYHHLLESSKALPNLRLKLEKDLALKDISAPKLIATVISLIQKAEYQ